MSDAESIKAIVKSHRAASHRVFKEITRACVTRQICGEQYRLFATNLATRTVFTLSEILAACLSAALDLDFLRIAYSIMTAADEGGFGKPTCVHPKLML